MNTEIRIHCTIATPSLHRFVVSPPMTTETGFVIKYIDVEVDDHMVTITRHGTMNRKDSTFPAEAATIYWMDGDDVRPLTRSEPDELDLNIARASELISV